MEMKFNIVLHYDVDPEQSLALRVSTAPGGIDVLLGQANFLSAAVSPMVRMVGELGKGCSRRNS